MPLRVDIIIRWNEKEEEIGKIIRSPHPKVRNLINCMLIMIRKKYFLLIIFNR
jgi:hypothetical protein